MLPYDKSFSMYFSVLHLYQADFKVSPCFFVSRAEAILVVISSINVARPYFMNEKINSIYNL